MGFHATRARAARAPAGVNRFDRSPSISVTLPPEDMRRLKWWAAKKGLPVASILRDAIWAYLLPIAGDADAAHRKEQA